MQRSNLLNDVCSRNTHGISLVFVSHYSNEAASSAVCFDCKEMEKWQQWTMEQLLATEKLSTKDA